MAEGDSSKMKTHVLLLGSTGHGKSSLANFLVNPTMDHVWEKSTFAVGESREPCTRQCSLGSSGEEVVMDTPGLNESHQKDLTNMINVVKEARKLGKAHAIVLVMKIDSRMDQIYKDTVQYYYDLFGLEACSSSLILVLTNFRHKDRQYAGGQGRAKVDQIVKQSSDDVKNFFFLEESPEVFCINSRPEDEEDLKFQLEVREKILNWARCNLCPANLFDLKVPKTAAVKQRHAEEAARLESSIDFKEKEKAQLASFPPAKVKQYQDLSCGVEKSDKDINRLSAEIEELDTEELVPIAPKSSITAEAGFGKGGNGDGWRLSFDFSVPIRYINTGGSSIDIVRKPTVKWETPYTADVIFERKRFEGLRTLFEQPGELTAECLGYKKEVYQAEIKEKRDIREKQQRFKCEALEKMATIEEKYGNLPPNINVEDRLLSLEDEIRSMKTRKAELKSPHFISIEEAEKEAQFPQSKL